MPDLSSISFLWPLMLYSAILVPAFGLAYAYVTKRFPPLILSLGLAMLCVAMARPQAVLMAPLREATVMLALDTSGSMRAKQGMSPFLKLPPSSISTFQLILFLLLFHFVSTPPLPPSILPSFPSLPPMIYHNSSLPSLL